LRGLEHFISENDDDKSFILLSNFIQQISYNNQLSLTIQSNNDNVDLDPFSLYLQSGSDPSFINTNSLTFENLTINLDTPPNPLNLQSNQQISNQQQAYLITSVSSATLLKLYYCKFDFDNNILDQSIFGINSGIFEMENSNFTNNIITQLTISPSFYFLSATTGTTLTFTNSFFKNISASNSLFQISNTLTQITFTKFAFENINRPVLELDNSNNSPITISVSNFSFLQSSSSMGGALKLGGNSNSLSISSSNFTNSNCAANGFGGAIYLDVTTPPSPFTLSSLSFSSNGPSTAIGKDLFIRGGSLVSLIPSDRFSWAVDNNQPKSYSLMGNGSSPFDFNVDLFIFLTGYKNQTYELAKTGNSGNYIYCRMIKYKYQTVIHVLEHKTAHTDRWNYLSLSSEASPENMKSMRNNHTVLSSDFFYFPPPFYHFRLPLSFICSCFHGFSLLTPVLPLPYFSSLLLQLSFLLSFFTIFSLLSSISQLCLNLRHSLDSLFFCLPSSPSSESDREE
jgi:hypothetical protein